jgi:hypothetical protein
VAAAKNPSRPSLLPTDMSRPQKITFGEMRSSGPTCVVVFCSDYRCAHSTVVDAAQWPDDIRLSDLEPRFVCKVCGHRGADVRPLFEERRALPILGTVEP